MDVVRLRTEQLAEASAVLARAFQDDPAWSWVIPDARRREALLPWLFKLSFEVTDADVWTTPGRVLGAARWLPPGRAGLRIGPTLLAFVATPLRLRDAMGRFLAYGRAVEQMRARVAPGPHWYLAGIGVEPAEQRRGVGSALLRPGLEGAARDGLPVVLLTNAERNLPFYRRNGFEIAFEDDAPPGAPHAWAMIRQP
ncbi:MAG: GNAT family N-acetyltransferase [Actinobacteria bacterium]|nr:GNAT family N-acetyltransferase [Actinomycetota bacterium]MBV8598598.1 GNAT family N-acetyltransferase [Actinomycetota bacterium]